MSATTAPPANAQDTLLDEADDSAGLLAEMNLVPVTSADADAAAAEVRANRSETAAQVAAQHDAAARLDELARGLVDLQTQRTALEAKLDRARAAEAEAHARALSHQAAADVAQHLLNEIAAAAYVGGGPLDADPLTTPEFSDAGRKARYASDLFDHTLATKREELAQASRAWADEHAAAADGAAQLDALGGNASQIGANHAEGEATTRALREAAETEVRLATELVELKADLAKARRLGRVSGVDFPLVLLDAFRKAEIFEQEHRPGCHLRWPLLAAISKIESNHGTFGGSKVAANGDTSMIVGPRLDGGNGFANIPDSDGGRLDGDPLYDRAVGPMQFIPSSWRIFGLDGNDDGVADPRNVYDATLAAGEHLCRAGYDLSTAEGFRRSVLGYNNSEQYLAQVASGTNRYLAFSW